MTNAHKVTSGFKNCARHILSATVYRLLLHRFVFCFGERNAVNLRLIFILAVGLFQLIYSAANACTLNEIQKPEVRDGFCRQQIGIATLPGCTSLVMTAQVADQFQQIALARRCGFNAEADKLEKFYNSTTPLVADLYECVDEPIDRSTTEQKAKQEVAKNLATLAPGCPDDLKAKMAKRLPKLIAIDEKSLHDIEAIAKQMDLKAARK
jgi:hypothetical protein